MAHKVVKYRLEADGTIPTWLTFGVPQSTGGMYAVADPNDPDATVAFDAAAHAQRVWDDLDALNA